MKTCAQCGKNKDDTEFYKDLIGHQDGLYSYCRACATVRLQKYRKNHVIESANTGKRYREKRKNNIEDSRLRSVYGITIDDFNVMFLRQKGCCAICGVHQSELKKKLSVDHDHKTGKIRGLLCYNCNHGLGSFMDNPQFLVAAIDYLEYNYEDIA